jgi:hypothetical protein
MLMMAIEKRKSMSSITIVVVVVVVVVPVRYIHLFSPALFSSFLPSF